MNTKVILQNCIRISDKKVLYGKNWTKTDDGIVPEATRQAERVSKNN